MVRIAVEAEVFQFSVSIHDDGTARIFIDATTLHADQPVFDDIDDADAVAGTDFIEGCNEFDSAQLLTVDGNRDTLFKVDLDVFRSIRSLFRCLRDHVDHVFRCIGRIFQVIPFMAQMPNVPVHAVRIGIFFGLIVDGHVMSFSVFQFVFTGFEVPHPPRSDESHFRSQGFDRQFKTDLVVALARSAMSDGIGAFFFSDFDEFLRNKGPSEGRTQEVFTFINSTGFDCRPNVLFHEFLFDVHDINFGSARSIGFLFNGFKVVRLANIGASSDDFGTRIIFLQPRNDDRRIEAAGISQDNFFNIFFRVTHDDFLLYLMNQSD